MPRMTSPHEALLLPALRGAARDVYPVEDRALQLLATDFDGIGTIGALNSLVQSVPGGSGIAPSNLRKIEIEQGAISELYRLRALDSQQ